MKCPFRINTSNINIKIEDGIYNTETHENYEECYGNGCPYYQPAGSIPSTAGELTFPESCKKTKG